VSHQITGSSGFRRVVAIIHPGKHGSERVELRMEVTDRTADTLILPRVTDLPGSLAWAPRTRTIVVSFDEDQELIAHLNSMARAAHWNADGMVSANNTRFALLDARLARREAWLLAWWQQENPAAVADTRQMLALAAVVDPARAVALVSQRITRRALAGAR
jgi:hypothetical protein